MFANSGNYTSRRLTLEALFKKFSSEIIRYYTFILLSLFDKLQFACVCSVFECFIPIDFLWIPFNIKSNRKISCLIYEDRKKKNKYLMLAFFCFCTFNARFTSLSSLDYLILNLLARLNSSLLVLTWYRFNHFVG